MARHCEPSIETALGWWSELAYKWTPVGWKDHAFRFDVLFDGTLHAQPYLERRGDRWKDLGVQISFVDAKYRQEDRMFVQGWDDCPAPALWTEWPQEGILVRQYVFAHVGPEKIDGIEPLYAWIRLKILDVCDPLPMDDRCQLPVRIEKPHIKASMVAGHNIRYLDDLAAYPRKLTAEAEDNPAHILRIVDPDGNVRLAVVGTDWESEFESEKPCLTLRLPVKKGAHVDLLVPMLPAPREAFDQELALGYDGALVEANRFWSQVPKTAAGFDCPEDYINQAVRRNLQMTPMIAERDPDTDRLALLTGSLHYQALWATPFAMTTVMFLDTLGYHEWAEHYLDIIRQEQGNSTPPSEFIPPHPGYLGTPKTHTSIDWITDHGALLWAISEHVLMSGDGAEEWLPVILKACEFVRDARRTTGHGGVEGLMPPAVNTDVKVATQAVWSDGWNYLGLATAARLLERLRHSKASEVRREANAYKAAFVNAFREKAAQMPTWTADDGSVHHLIPTALSGDRPEDTRHLFYLDAGPLFLVFSGLLDARDPLMKSALKWFREGPQAKWYRYDAGHRQTPCLVHEISSCEPVYSWSFFHSHQLGDRARFLEGMYSLFAGSISQQTFTVCETRHGVMGLCHCLPSVWLARLAVIDDQIEPGSLHLLRLVPLAWLRTDRKLRFERMPTEFGPVTVILGLSKDGKQLDVRFEDEFRIKPEKIVLHIPPVRGITGVALNGKKVWLGGKRSITL